MPHTPENIQTVGQEDIAEKFIDQKVLSRV